MSFTRYQITKIMRSVFEKHANEPLQSDRFHLSEIYLKNQAVHSFCVSFVSWRYEHAYCEEKS